MDSQNEIREREILTEFISMYIDLPCLWDSSSETYKEKNRKLQAWERLTEKLKEVEAEANISKTKKKIEHFRTAFKREYKKVKESKRTGAGSNDVHIPNLWYFNLLLPIFEKKDEQSRCGVDTLSSDEESTSTENVKCRKRNSSLEMKKQTLIETAQKILLSEGDTEKRKKMNSFGMYVGEQLEQLETFQRQVAEKLISEILFLARTGNLNFESKIETRMQQAPSYQLIHSYASPHQTYPSPYFINQPSPSHIFIHSSPLPQHIQPSPSSQHTQSSPSPQHIQPSPSPQHIQSSSSPQYILPSPSPHLQILSQGFQPARHPLKFQLSPISPSSSKQHFQLQHSQPSSSHYIQTANEESASTPSSSHSISNAPRNIMYEGPASGINDFIIFKNDK